MITLEASSSSGTPMYIPSAVQNDPNSSYEPPKGESDSFLMLITDCDNIRDQIMSERKKQMILRSGTKNHSPEKIVKKDSRDTSVDSDDENNLVIDCDISSEENQPSNSKKQEKLNLRVEKNLYLRTKLLNGHSSISETDSSTLDTQKTDANCGPPNLITKKKKKMKFKSKWYKSSHIKNGDIKKLKKPLKRLLQRTKLKDKMNLKLTIKSPTNEQDENENLSKKNECPICQVAFADSHSFTLHIREHNTDKLSHVCKICTKQLSSASSLDRHMYVHSGERPFECSICKLRFTTNGNMHRHMKIHEENDKAKTKTETKSNKRILNDSSKDSLPTSLSDSQDNSHFSSENGEPIPKKAALDASSEMNGSDMVSCSICGRQFMCDDALKSHMDMHSNLLTKCNECFECYATYETHICPEKGLLALDFPRVGFHDLTFVEFSSPKFPFIAKQICEKQSRNSSCAFFSWECHKCAKAFPSNEALYQHELSHEVNNNTCEICRCDFSSSKNFCNHQLKHRLTEQCSENVKNPTNESAVACQEDFLAMLELRRTQPFKEVDKKNPPKLRHFDSMKYFVHDFHSNKCKNEESTNDFADIKSIISLTSKTPIMPDMQTSPITASPASPPPSATGAAPSSPIIEGSANPPSNLGAMSEDYSNSEFAKGDNISKDYSSRENFDCKKCSETFMTSIALKQHMRAHSKSTPLHQCNFCPYQSVDKSTLKRHMRKHNGEHPFKCSICDYVFTTKANGHRHVKNKHKLSEQEAVDAVVYNPNMLESKDSDGVVNESNNSETVCKYCKVDFKYNRVLRHHLRSLNNSCSHKPYSCGVCKQGFSTKNNCIRHITNHHPESKNNAKELVVVNELSNTNSQDRNASVNDEVSEGEVVTMETQPLNLVFSGNEENMNSGDQDSQEFSGSDAEMAVAQSLVSLSEVIPPQDKPLDLTLCALDLTVKDNVKITAIENPSSLEPEVLNLCTSSNTKTIDVNEKTAELSLNQLSPVNLELVAQPLNLAKKSPIPISLVKKASETSNSHVITGKSPISLMCLPQILTPVRGFLGENISLPIYSNPKPVSTLSSPETCSNETMQSDDMQKNAHKVKKFSCDICFKGFTLKSNRERHIKNHHPEHARPPRSRNYIPTLSPTSVQKQSSSTLSERTRDALRVALIAKTSSCSKLEDSIKTTDNQSTSLNQIPTTNFTCQFPTYSASSPLPLTKNKSNACILPSKDKTDNADLASVSDVIDTVNCQNFKQYLLDAKGTSDSSGADESNGQDIEILNEADSSLPCNSKACEKKSSYAKCTKSIHCTYCKRKFPWKSSLSRHFLTHTGLKPHKCPKCPLSFTTKSNRDRHLFRQHSGVEESATLSDKHYKCNSCPGSFFSTKGKLKKHFYLKHLPKNELNSSVNDSNNRTATVKSAKSSESLSNNFQGKQSAEESCSDMDASLLLECHLCANIFKSQEDLLSHLKEAHPVDMDVSSPEKSCLATVVKIEPVDDDPSCENIPSVQAGPCRDERKFHCPHCLLQFADAHELEEHAKIHLENSTSPRKGKVSPGKKNNGEVNLAKNNRTAPKNCSSPKKKPNSLLYLFAAAQQAQVDQASKSKTVLKSKTRIPGMENATEDENSLILNLLGLKDPEFLDEMLDSAVRSRVKKEKDDS